MSMTTSTKKCVSCKRQLEVTKFREGRNVCMSCKSHQHGARVSESYENYLRNLFTHSRSAVKCGKRTKPDLEWDITADDLVELWEQQKGRCAISGVYLTHHKDGSGAKDFNASIDRKSNEKGYTINNIHLVCYRINIMKHTLSEDMFYWWIKTINDFSCD